MTRGLDNEQGFQVGMVFLMEPHVNRLILKISFALLILQTDRQTDRQMRGTQT
jgi:hypothetical protein